MMKSLAPPFPPTQLPAVTTVKSQLSPLPPAKIRAATTVKSQLSTLPPHSAPSTIDSSTAAPEDTLSLQLEAVPDHPVAEGQRVTLLCRASPMPASAQWSWQRLQNHTWHVMQDGGDLTLSQPEQSGLYRCRAEGRSSQSHAVYITSMQTTVSEYLGIAAFVLSLLALVIISAHLFWLSYRRLDATLTTPNVAAQGEVCHTLKVAEMCT
ncbi:hypothetical protein EYF80_028772 [Liparis tanakae]|uniref:Ig-like domain-containing protein n=1 Tax=Liparis tanakae TaxID=230148 RepID=A0A4Z2H817_9TELE|nr:hypothetical protein EYF80_028772 [Liparis tanakae]